MYMFNSKNAGPRRPELTRLAVYILFAMCFCLVPAGMYAIFIAGSLNMLFGVLFLLFLGFIAFGVLIWQGF